MIIPRLSCALVGLGMGLLFYLAHRSDHTVSNRLVSWLCGPLTYVQIKQELRHWLPVPMVLRGCLPSALWCFIVTSLFGSWKMRIVGCRVLPLAWFCPLINAGWEVIQWIGWTDGHADGLDVVAGFVGCFIAHALLLSRPIKPVEIPALWSWRVGLVITGFACMGFADVGLKKGVKLCTLQSSAHAAETPRARYGTPLPAG